MKLKQTLAYPATGYWNGGKKQVFLWKIDTEFSDGKSRVGSWDANHYFEVRTGPSEKATLANARRHLQAVTRIPSSFEYVED